MVKINKLEDCDEDIDALMIIGSKGNSAIKLGSELIGSEVTQKQPASADVSSLGHFLSQTTVIRNLIVISYMWCVVWFCFYIFKF